MNWIGNIIKSHRRENGESQAETAKRLGISRNYLGQTEREQTNISFAVALKILNLGSQHGQIEVVLPRRVMVDASIAAEVVFLNHCDVITEGSCQGPPPTALIRPSSAKNAEALGYEPIYSEDVGLFEINLKSKLSTRHNHY